VSYCFGCKITIKKSLEEEKTKKTVKKAIFCNLCFAISSFFIIFAPVFNSKTA